MKMGLTVLGVAARLARWRIARAREQAIRNALQSISDQRQQQAERTPDRAAETSNASRPNKK